MGNRVTLTGHVYRHAMAQRLSRGQVIRIVAGNTVYLARVDGGGKGFVTARITEVCQNPQSGLRVHLYPALLKGQKLDLVVEKCTELGVASIQPVITKRTISSIAPEKVQSRKDRWERIARSAAEQCTRPHIPLIGNPTPLADVLKTGLRGLGLFAYEGESSPTDFAALVDRWTEVSVIIGPEGGFDASEVSKATQSGLIPVSLGPFMLKADTASMAAAAVLMACGSAGRNHETPEIAPDLLS